MSSFDELGIGPESEAAMKDFGVRKSISVKDFLNTTQFPNSRPDAFVVMPDGSGGAKAVGVSAKEINDDKINVARRRPTEESVISPTRTYVAVCNKGNFNGHYLRKFTIPFDVKGPKGKAEELDNHAAAAQGYFTSVFDRAAVVTCVIAWEDFVNMRDCQEIIDERELAAAEAAIDQLAGVERDGDDLYPDFTV